MLEELTACECTTCDSTLTDADCQLIYDTPAGRRRVYECDCGAVTITVQGSATGV